MYRVYFTNGTGGFVDEFESRFPPIIDAGALIFYNFGIIKRAYAAGVWTRFEELHVEVE